MAERAFKSVPTAADENAEAREAPTVALAPQAPAPRLAAEGRTTRRKRSSLRWGLFALLPLALVLSGYEYVAGGQIMSTDDAYVEAEKVGVSTDVSGIVEKVDVTNNQHVDAGQVLYRLDPKQFQ